MKINRSRTLIVLGLGLMVVGVVDPMEGSVVVLAGSALAAIGGFLSRSRYRLQVAAAAMVGIGVVALFALSAIGGVGGNSGRSIWWLLLCAPYPAGWLLGLVAASLKLREPRTSPA